MASLSAVYRLTGEQLRQECRRRSLGSEGPIRTLRNRLATYLRTHPTDTVGYVGMEASGGEVSQVSDVGHPVPVPPVAGNTHGGSVGEEGRVLTELLRRIPALNSEEAVDVLRFFMRAQEIQALGLVPDRGFLVHLLPLVSGSLLSFLGDCIRKGTTWAQCRAQLLDDYFPYFVRERLIRDLVVFNFQREPHSLRKYIDEVFDTAAFLNYAATEEQLVDRVVMNFHPDVLGQAAFLDKPRSRKDLYRVVSSIEEKLAVLSERRAREGPKFQARRDGGRTVTDPKVRNFGTGPGQCWRCRQVGHQVRNCPQKPSQAGNGRLPGGAGAPGQV
jgi:hypothetical protein